MTSEYTKAEKKRIGIVLLLGLTVALLFFLSLMVGSSGMSVSDCLQALMKQGSAVNNRILWSIRIPRALAAVIAGAGLAMSGLVMQTGLNNSMASPSTLGVTNAAVFGANLSIIVFAGGFLTTGNNFHNFDTAANPYATSLMAFLFSLLSVLMILGLCSLRSFSPNVVVLAGIAMGSLWTAATTILQFYATDVGLSAAVIWNFGDLGRATYRTDGIMAVTVALGFVFFYGMRWIYNALLSGDITAGTMGISVGTIRFLSLLVSAIVTAVCVSFLGIIGFVGIICPHIVKRLWGQDHRLTIPASALTGSILLLLADTFARSLGNGSALPVGAITSALGGPFFLLLIFSGRGRGKC